MNALQFLNKLRFDISRLDNWEDVILQEARLQESETFDAKAISDLILNNIRQKAPNKIKRFSKSQNVTKASEGFNFQLTPAEKDEFLDYYKGILEEEVDGQMTRATQLRILDDASHNYLPAVRYLYARYLRLIAKVYETYYVRFIQKGNPNLNESDIRSEESVAATRLKALELLGNTVDERRSSPYRSFKPEMYDSEANLLDHFGYWAITRGLEYPTIQLAKEFENGGLTGKRSEGDDTRVASLDARLEADSHDEPFEDSSEEQSDAIMMLNHISDYLSTYKHPRFKVVFDMFRQGYSTKDIAAELNISPENVNALWKRVIKAIKEEFGENLLDD